MFINLILLLIALAWCFPFVRWALLIPAGLYCLVLLIVTIVPEGEFPEELM